MSDFQVNVEQAPTVPNGHTPVWDLVMADMRERKEMGRAKYGTYLQSFNGRLPLIDAYQELLDLVVYVRQEIEEAAQLRAQILAMLKDDPEFAARWERIRNAGQHNAEGDADVPKHS